MQEWCEDSRLVEPLEAEICFLLQKDFYVGDPDDPEQLNDIMYRETLLLPRIERASEMLVKTSEAEGNEASLAEYYRDIARRAKGLHRSLNDVRQYFWCGLWFLNEAEGVRISFPWHGTLDRIKSLFNDFRNTESGVIVHIQDHGWGILVLSDGGYIYIKEWDPDEEEIWLNIKVERDLFLRGLQRLEARAQKVINRLSEELGEDLWSEHLDASEFNL
jgi:hypothetical protein